MEKDCLLAITLFGAGDKRLCGPAMVKASSKHTVSRVIACFAGWAGVKADAVQFHDMAGNAVSADVTVAAAGFPPGRAVVNAMLAPGASGPSAEATLAPFAMLDVTDSELAALAGGLMQ